MTVKKNDISFEEALKDLEKIVEDLNNGDMELEKAITAYEKGIELKNIDWYLGEDNGKKGKGNFTREI